MAFQMIQEATAILMNFNKSPMSGQAWLPLRTLCWICVLGLWLVLTEQAVIHLVRMLPVYTQVVPD